MLTPILDTGDMNFGIGIIGCQRNLIEERTEEIRGCLGMSDPAPLARIGGIVVGHHDETSSGVERRGNKRASDELLEKPGLPLLSQPDHCSWIIPD